MNPMDSSVTIFGDWGTSRLRLYLRKGRVMLDRRDGPGIGALNGASPRDVFLNLVSDWREKGASQALLCGMVGSRNGWVDAGCAGIGVGGELYRPGYTAEEVGTRAKALVAAWAEQTAK